MRRKKEGQRDGKKEGGQGDGKEGGEGVGGRRARKGDEKNEGGVEELKKVDWARGWEERGRG